MIFIKQLNRQIFMIILHPDVENNDLWKVFYSWETLTGFWFRGAKASGVQTT